MFLRALGFKPKSNSGALRAKLPALHAFVDISLSRGVSGTASIDAITSKTIATAVVPGLTVGSVAIFVYTNPTGKFRFTTKCTAIAGAQAVFAFPKAIESLQRAGPAASGAQKRSSVRLETTVPAQWRHASGGQGKGEFMRGSLADISRTGASLISDREVSKGSQVEVRLALNSDSAPLLLLSEVLRTSRVERSGKHSLGLQFHGMSQADDRAVMDFINKRQADRRSRGLA